MGNLLPLLILFLIFVIIPAIASAIKTNNQRKTDLVSLSHKVYDLEKENAKHKVDITSLQETLYERNSELGTFREIEKKTSQ